MSKIFPSFCGPSYQFSNPVAAIERCINWYTTPIEASDGIFGTCSTVVASDGSCTCN